MNADTRVAVCCYAGDQYRMITALGQILHHQCPVVALSPTDSPAVIRYPGVENRQNGKVGYVGQVSLDRMRDHLRCLLEFPEKFFLVHDADSLCLSPGLPRYLYQEGKLWSNLLVNPYEEQWKYYPPGFPKVAFQSPYWMSRGVIERLLDVADTVKINPGLPFIDHYMVQLAVAAGCPFDGFTGGFTGLTEDAGGVANVVEAVSRGAMFVHAIKRKEVLDAVVAARQEFLRRG